LSNLDTFSKAEGSGCCMIYQLGTSRPSSIYCCYKSVRVPSGNQTSYPWLERKVI